MNVLSEQLLSRLTTPIGMLLGVCPIEIQLRITKTAGDMKRKNKRSKFLLMLIIFLMVRAKMFEIDGQLIDWIEWINMSLESNWQS